MMTTFFLHNKLFLLGVLRELLVRNLRDALKETKRNEYCILFRRDKED